MTDYIKRSDISYRIDYYLSHSVGGEHYAYEICTKEIQNVPKADVVEVKHSKWIGFPNNGVWDLKCDNCHRIIPFGQTPETMHYCPQCGAKMDMED